MEFVNHKYCNFFIESKSDISPFTIEDLNETTPIKIFDHEDKPIKFYIEERVRSKKECNGNMSDAEQLLCLVNEYGGLSTQEKQVYINKATNNSEE